MTNTCVLYGRVSGKAQAEAYGLDAQLDDCRAWAEREGYRVLAEFTDRGGKGSKRDTDPRDRVGFGELLRFVAGTRVDAVLAANRDRYGERYWPEYAADLLALHGTTARAMNDTGNPYGDAVTDVSAGEERKKIAERSRRGKLRKARQGYVLALGQPNYGYRYTPDRNHYVIEPDHMALMGRIFRMIGPEGMSLHGVRKTLNGEGWPTPSAVWSEFTREERAQKGKDPLPASEHWSGPFIRGVVTDDCYKAHTPEELDALMRDGHMTLEVRGRLDPSKCYGVWWYVGTDWDGSKARIAVPIPDSGTPREWVDLARKNIAGNVKTMPKGGGRFWELGGGVFRCSCGWTMQGNSRKNSAKPDAKLYHGYRCARRIRHGADACGQRVGYNAVEIEAEVWALVSRDLSDPAVMLAGLDALIELEREKLHGDPEREEMMLMDRLNALEQERRGYLRQNARGVLSDGELDEYLAGVEEHRPVLEKSLSESRSRRARLDELERIRAEWASGRSMWLSYVPGGDLRNATPEQRRELYRRHGVKVWAFPDGSIQIDGVCLPENASRSRAPPLFCG